ncbi:MAG: TraR/DksA C4-type zinc finger protein [Providencia heimbachae]|nr:TraR/DksA C4-type zinc finger protein [Providencia heimbachae]
MADEIDASQIESDFLLSLRLSKRTLYQGDSAEFCVTCGEPIPIPRRLALPGIQHCVYCIERQELSGSR